MTSLLDTAAIIEAAEKAAEADVGVMLSGNPLRIEKAHPFYQLGPETILRLAREHREGVAVTRAALIPSAYHGAKGFELERFLTDYAVWLNARRAFLSLVNGEGS